MSRFFITLILFTFVIAYIYYLAVQFLSSFSDRKASTGIRRLSLAGGILALFLITLFQSAYFPIVKDARHVLSGDVVVVRGFIDAEAIRIPVDGLVLFQRVDMKNRRHMTLPFSERLQDGGYYEITYLPNTGIIIKVESLQNYIS